VDLFQTFQPVTPKISDLILIFPSLVYLLTLSRLILSDLKIEHCHIALQVIIPVVYEQSGLAVIGSVQEAEGLTN